MATRRTAVAGSWYPDRPQALTRDLDRYLAAGDTAARASGAEHVVAVLAPHAGLMYSGPVAGHAYALLRGRAFDAIVLVGPSHYVGFDGVAVSPDDAFDTPLGPLRVDSDLGRRLAASSPVIEARRDAHAREHSLELQLPFVKYLFDDVPIVPLVIGEQTRETIEALAEVLADVLAGARVLLVASSDLSHFFDADRADRLDARTADFVRRFDADGLVDELDAYPLHDRGRYVMCGGGAAAAVMGAARSLGARDARVLARSHSGVTSGDYQRVVGYLAAGFGTFAPGAAAV